MTADTIRRLLFNPSVAVARLGGSTSPMASFSWGPGDPHTIAETRIRPEWTLDVDAAGNVTTRLPTSISVRDGALQRPVAPFLELWALTGDGPADGWVAQPVTPALLASNGVVESDVTFTVTAMNQKAAHRASRPNLRFGTFPPVSLTGDDHGAVLLRGESPPSVANPMVPAGQFIPLGSVQIMRPQTQPANPPFPPEIRLDVLRLRFTPAAGLCYGPPQAAATQPPAVPAERAFLNDHAGWFDAPMGNVVVPADTFDAQDTAQGQTPRSLGVVDDTCDAVVTAAVTIGGAALGARANVTVGPPHFAPDRRPFLSIADEINDREDDAAARDAVLTPGERDAWVEDLFERIAETVSLFDLDYWRGLSATLTGSALAATSIPDDGVPAPTRAMGGRDALRDRDIAIAPRSEIEPFPLSARARERHRALSDLNQLKSWILAHPDRLAALVRAPFSVPTTTYADAFTMQMPPFMANSNRWPLALSNWQYRLLMAWKGDVVATGGPALIAADEGVTGLSSSAAERRRQVLDVLGEDEQ